jgi:hypothetical protein
LVFAPATARAETITFDQWQQGGTLTTSGGDTTGTNIIFEFITYDANDDGVVDSTLYCGDTVTVGTDVNTNCYLNFDTATNTFTLTAPSGLYTLGNTLVNGTITGGTLVTGTTGVILDGTFTTSGFDVTGLQFNATGLDTKNQAMLDYFGSLTAATDFKFNSTTIRRDSTGAVTQADITNTNIPEPGLLTLFGLGLLGVGRKLARNRG